MNREFWKKNSSRLALIAAATFVICVITMAFYKPQGFTVGIKKAVSILKPFVYGFVIAYLLKPLTLRIEGLIRRFFEKLPFPAARQKTSPGNRRSGTIRLIASVCSMLLLFTLLAWMILLLLPQMISSITSIVSRMPQAVRNFQEWLSQLEAGDTGQAAIGYINETLSTLTEKLQNYLQTSTLPLLQSAIGSVTSSFMGLFNVLKNFGLGCIISIYLLCSWEKFSAQIKLITYSIFPSRAADWIKEEACFTDRMFSGFIRGKIVDSAIIGVLCFIVSALLRFPYAALVSVIVGVTNVIPFFGPYLGAIPSVLLILTESVPKAIGFLIFIIILQQVDGNVIGPRILGDRLGLSSFWILFSILVFGALWGIVGMLVGAPVFAVLYDLIRKAIFRGLRARGRTDLKDQYSDRFT